MDGCLCIVDRRLCKGFIVVVVWIIRKEFWPVVTEVRADIPFIEVRIKLSLMIVTVSPPCIVEVTTSCTTNTEAVNVFPPKNTGTFPSRSFSWVRILLTLYTSLSVCRRLFFDAAFTCPCSTCEESFDVLSGLLSAATFHRREVAAWWWSLVNDLGCIAGCQL